MKRGSCCGGNGQPQVGGIGGSLSRFYGLLHHTPRHPFDLLELFVVMATVLEAWTFGDGIGWEEERRAADASAPLWPPSGVAFLFCFVCDFNDRGILSLFRWPLGA